MRNPSSYTPSPLWIDSHIHLDADPYEQDLPSVLKASAKAGVTACVLPALHLESAQTIEQLHQQNPQLYPTAGIHPHEAQRYSSQALDKCIASSHNRIVAVGETGIEGHYDFVPQEKQRESFQHHIELAKKYSLPLIVHCRESEEIVYQALKPYRGEVQGVIHCFTGDWEWAKKFLDLGFYIGLTGVVTFKNAHQVHDVASRMPLERLLVETDGPYLAPVPFRGKRNQPAYIPYIGEAIARIRSEPLGKVAQYTYTNTVKLFALPLPPYPSEGAITK